MNISDWSALAELVSSIAVVASLIYLAIEIRQNTSQQKREETISIQHGQNSVISQMLDPRVVSAYAKTAADDGSASPQDQSTAIIFVLQYLNHFQIVCDLYDSGSLTDERFELWKSFAVSVVASKGIRKWWEDEGGMYAFMPRVRKLIQERLDDERNPPLPFNDLWTAFSSKSWSGMEKTG